MAYSYDRAGNLASATNAASTSTYGYDNRNLATSVTDPSGKVIDFANDTTGRRTDTWFNDTTGHATFAAHTHTDYDASSRITRVWTSQNSSDSSRASDLSYSYAAPGSSVCATSAPASGADTGLRWSQTDNITGAVTSYCYDQANRLTTASTSGGDSWEYTYDSDGNRLTATKNGTVVQSFGSFNSADQITGSTYSYDGAGNTAIDPTNSAFGYSDADQMTSRTDRYTTPTTSRYGYAGTTQNELVSDSARNYTYGRTTKQGVPLVESYTALGSTYSYVYDPQGTPLAMEGSNTHYLALDGLGSPVALIKQDGATTGTYSYDPWGQVTATAVGGSGATGVQIYSFVGGIDDPTSTLEHFGRRWYDPSIGRFTQQDDLQVLADPSRANRFEYAGDNPNNYVDLTGRCSIDTWVHYGLGLIIGVATAVGGALTSEVGVGIAGMIAGWGVITDVTYGMEVCASE